MKRCGVFFPIVLAFLFFGTQPLFSQKVLHKTLIKPGQQYIHVDTKNCASVTFQTATIDELVVTASIEGEYAKELVVKIEEDGSNVLIGADFLPSFIHPNDKLSAHKVISIDLNITMPQQGNLSLTGTNTEIIGSGSFSRLQIILADGNCSLKNISGNLDIKTQNGAISIKNASGKVVANTVYGRTILGNVAESYHTINLQSVEGDISVNNTK